MTLTLDASAKPVGLISIKDAVAQLAEQIISGRSDISVLAEDESRRFRSQFIDMAAPLIILNSRHYVQITPNEAKYVSKRVMFARDSYTCQYCGFEATPGKAHAQLTLDHVKPARLFKTRKDATTWDNVTTACSPCNNKKGGQLPRDCGMMPRTTPKAPTSLIQMKFFGHLNQVQRDYIEDYYGSSAPF